MWNMKYQAFSELPPLFLKQNFRNFRHFFYRAPSLQNIFLWIYVQIGRFSKIMKVYIFWDQIFFRWVFLNPPWAVMLDQFAFLLLLDSNKQTNKHTNKKTQIYTKMRGGGLNYLQKFIAHRIVIKFTLINHKIKKKI